MGGNIRREAGGANNLSTRNCHQAGYWIATS
jgi:hypothetical protein